MMPDARTAEATPTQGQPIRVLHICGALAGGVGTVLLTYYRHIDRDQVQFDFLVHGEPDAEVRAEVEAMGGIINVITPKSQGLLRNLREAGSFINRRTPHQIIHVHTASPTSFLYLLLAWLVGKRVRVAHSHATSLECPPKSLQFRLHRMLQPVLRAVATDQMACSLAAGRWLFGERHFTEAQVLPNAIEVDRYRFVGEEREEIRRELHLDDRLVVGHVGRFVEPKNHQFLIRVFSEVAKREPRAVLLLVGDGPLREDVMQQVAETQLGHRVRFLGERRDVASLLSAMDVFVLPSNFEGLPLVLVEAQASGIPSLVSTEVTREIAITPLLHFESLGQEPQTWADQVLQLATQNRESEASALVAEAGYDIDRAAPRLADFYRRRTQPGRDRLPQ